MNNNNKKISVVLIEPTCGHDVKHSTGGHNEFEPLGLEYIDAVLRARGCSTKLIRQMSKSTTEILADILLNKPDLVCFTVLTYNYPESLQLATELKNIDEKIQIVFGGYHPSTVPEEVAREWAIDFVVIGEGEETICELCDAIKNGQNYESVFGIAFMKNEQYVRTTKRKRIANLDALPFPSRSIEILTDCRIYGLMYPPPSKQINTTSISCSRGCPYNCEFCCSRTVWGEKAIHRSPANIVKEIIEVRNTYKTNSFFFTDLTFNSNRKWVVDFCQEIVNSGIKFNWYCMCTIIGLDEHLIKLMSEAGCKKIGFGIEALGDEKEEIKSFKRPPIATMNEVFENCFNHGIFTKSYFMIGFSSQTPDDLNIFRKLLNELKVDEIKISFYTPFPGTTAYTKHKHRLINSDYSHFDTLNYLVVSNDYLTEKEFKEIRTEIIKSFYNNEQYISRAKKNIKQNPYLLDSYIDFFDFLKFKKETRNKILRSN